jgi:hypothetical protein
VSILSYPWIWQLLRDIMLDASFLCDKAAMLREGFWCNYYNYMYVIIDICTILNGHKTNKKVPINDKSRHQQSGRIMYAFHPVFLLIKYGKQPSIPWVLGVFSRGEAVGARS